MSSIETKAALRRCVGCRQSDDEATMLRFVGHQGRLYPDPGQRLPGRGAWAHRKRGCMTRGLKRGGFAHALHGQVEEQIEPLLELCRQACRGAALSRLGLLRRGGRLRFGRDEVCAAIAEAAVLALWLAQDAASRTQRQIRQLAEQHALDVVQVGGCAEMGESLGTATVAVVAVPLGRAGQCALRELRTWCDMQEHTEVYKVPDGA